MCVILHFSDAHIDVCNYGRHDIETGLPLRTLDFLKALDTIVDCAIEENVDLVLFTGDAYKDRTPVPTYQREWGKRMMRLSRAGIRTILLAGNHDVSPAAGRAHALQEYETLLIPHISVISKPSFLTPDELEGLPIQLIALPWIWRSGLIASQELSTSIPELVYEELLKRLMDFTEKCLTDADASLPVIMAAHMSVEGATYGSERSVILGNDIVLPGGLLRDKRFSYVALGHIHKAQDLNEGSNPPIVYPGSIEKVDFGEVNDDKYFVIAHVNADQPTTLEWKKIPGRKFIDRRYQLEKPDDIKNELWDKLPEKEELAQAIVRFTLEYPRHLEPHIDDAALRKYAEESFEFHLVRKPQTDARLRLSEDVSISSLSPLELLVKYCDTIGIKPEESSELKKLAADILSNM